MGTLLFPEWYYCTKYGIFLQSPPVRTPTQHQPLSNIIFPIMLNNIMLIFQTYICRGLYHYLPLLQSSLFCESILLFVLIYATICQNIISEIACFSKMSGKKYFMFTKIKVIINPTEVFKWGHTQDFFPSSIMPFLIEWTGLHEECFVKTFPLQPFARQKIVTKRFFFIYSYNVW